MEGERTKRRESGVKGRIRIRRWVEKGERMGTGGDGKGRRLADWEGGKKRTKRRGRGVEGKEGSRKIRM